MWFWKTFFESEEKKFSILSHLGNNVFPKEQLLSERLESVCAATCLSHPFSGCEKVSFFLFVEYQWLQDFIETLLRKANGWSIPFFNVVA